MKHINESAFSFNDVHNHADLKAFLKDEYNWWSSIARVLHCKYKIYSSGLLNRRESPKVITDDERTKYWKIMESEEPADKEMCRRLTWLEHRRWNAFLRAKGFTAPSAVQWEKYSYKEEGITHKHVDLKLHPCIVECSDSIRIMESDWDDPLYINKTHLDSLDVVSVMVYQKQKSLYEKKEIPDIPDKTTSDYKIWDAPNKGEDNF